MMIDTSKLPLFIFFLRLILSYLADRADAKQSFTVDLIHRDSLLLSHENYSITSSELLRKAVLRSFTQANHYNSSLSLGAKYIAAGIVRNGAENKNYEVLALASTRSDLIWINCYPCKSSYRPRVDPFIPSWSTYQIVPYRDEFCDALKATKERTRDNGCLYEYSYEKKGTTSGILSSDNFYFNYEDQEFARIGFRCSHKTEIKFESTVQGIIGLGTGKLSLISQLINNTQIERAFSYCLVSRSADTNSKITFRKREINSNETVLIPFAYKARVPFYYLTLKSISIGETDIISISPFRRDVIIDLGVAMTLLPSDTYDELESSIKNKVGIEPTPDPRGTFKLCYEKRQLNYMSLPKMEFNFVGGGLPLKNEHMFVDYDIEYRCLAIAPYDGISIIGNTAQIDFLVEYDLQNKKIALTSTDCNKLP